jgi:ribosomal protein S24E
MTIITITKSKTTLKKRIADYYKTTADKITINAYGNVYNGNRKTRLQTDLYNGVYVCAFVK